MVDWAYVTHILLTLMEINWILKMIVFGSGPFTNDIVNLKHQGACQKLMIGIGWQADRDPKKCRRHLWNSPLMDKQITLGRTGLLCRQYFCSMKNEALPSVTIKVKLPWRIFQCTVLFVIAICQDYAFNAIRIHELVTKKKLLNSRFRFKFQWMLIKGKYAAAVFGK